MPCPYNAHPAPMSDQRLPLPGEQPVTVWRPRTRRRPRLGARRMLLWRLLPWAVLALLIFAGQQGWRLTATPVTVVVNGEPITFGTHRRTVAGAARAAGVRPDETVYIDPAAETPLTPGMVITVAQLRPVLVHVDGETLSGPARSADPQQILAALGIALAPADAVRIERAVRPAPAEVAANPALAAIPIIPREMRIMRPATVIVQEGGQRVAFQSSAPTLGEALSAAGYILYEADRLSLPPGTPLPSGGQIEVAITRAAAVSVQADGRLRTVRTHQPTVGALLDELGLTLSGGDYVLPDAAAPLSAGMAVRVVRVREEVLTEHIPLPFEITYIPDPDLALDTQRVIQHGVDGVLERRVRVRYEDGAEVSRAPEGEWVVRQPQAQVVGYGTQIVIRTLRTRLGDFQYWRKLHVLATSYSPSTAGYKPPDDPYLGLSATGDPVRQGVIAVDPRVIPLYTYLYVPGYGPGRALDIGGAVKGYRIDLGYTDEELVLWNEWVDVYLLVPVPPPDEMIWVLP